MHACLVGHDRRPASFLVYLWLTSEQARRHRAVQNAQACWHGSPLGWLANLDYRRREGEYRLRAHRQEGLFRCAPG